MRLLAAEEAQLGVTVQTNANRIFLAGWFANRSTAGSVRAPPEVRVEVDHCICQEAFVLQKEVSVDTVLDIGLLVIKIATTLHASDVDDVTISDCIC